MMLAWCMVGLMYWLDSVDDFRLVDVFVDDGLNLFVDVMHRALARDGRRGSRCVVCLVLGQSRLKVA